MPSFIIRSVFLGLFAAFLYSQTESVHAQTVNGSAVQLSCNCFRLTEALQTQGGSVWNNSQISLEDPFDFTFDVYLGDIPGGADGIAFVLQPVSTLVGSSGGGLGYEGISPSLAMSIDTYDNGPIHADIVPDHVAIMSNGAINHASADNLAGPVIALVSGANIEDGLWHLMRVSWDPVSMTVRFYMDGSLRLSYTGDIINDIFLGDPMVFWGFTGSTGGLYNLQQFCFSVIPGLSSNFTEICEGESIEFNDNSYSALGAVVGWEWDFGDGQTSNEQVPGAVQFDQAGSYWVTQTVVDAEGCDALDSIQVVVHPNPEAAFSATEVCEGDETQFTDQSTVETGSIVGWEWDLGTGPVAGGPTTINTFTDAGIYDVTLAVATNFGCADTVGAEVSVFENPQPNITHETTGLEASISTVPQSGETTEWTILDSTYTDLNTVNFTFPDSGTHIIILEVTNANGCVNSIEYPIYVEGIPEYTVPNVFTPNDDDVNDRFQPYTYAMVSANMRIFNRWGRPVFKYEGAIPQMGPWGWDGSVNGKAKANDGTYYYMLDLVGTDGNTFSEKGTVTLLR